MLKAYKPTIPTALIQQQVGYGSRNECIKDLREMGLRFKDGGVDVDKSVLQE